MHLAPHWEVCVGGVALLAVTAKALRAVAWSGAAAGVAVGGAIALGFGWPGLAVLATFFVVGSAATKFGYARKAARGTAQPGGGARTWQNVVGKGGVAAALGAAAVAGHALPLAFAGSVAAALADTLGTELGTLSRGTARSLPTLRAVPHGTPGAVSLLGIAGCALGAVAVIAAASAAALPFSTTGDGRSPAPAILAAGLGGALLESLVVSLAPSVRRVPGWIRNVLTTAAGAAIAHVAYGEVLR